jgi:hypothetical protein
MRFLLAVISIFVALDLRAAEVPSSSEVRIELASPVDFQIVQRSGLKEGILVISGKFVVETRDTVLPDELQVLVSGNPSFGRLPADWQSLPCDDRVAAFRADLRLPAGGWYRLEVRAFRKGIQVASTVIEHVGVGEIFVVAGQSNSANHGEERQNTQSGMVAAFDGMTWQLARDPMPGASGSKGSFMPPFGDEMFDHFHVPIGIVAMGVGATSVREWLPVGTPLSRLPTLTGNVVTTGENQWEASGKIYENFVSRMKQLGTNGFRSVLWHQGESDANQADPTRTLPGELYRKYLEQLIRDSRAAIGWNAPWFVAQVSYHSHDDPSSPDIRAAQKLCWEDGIALPGPDTDTLTGDMREKNGTGVHLSGKGLKAHSHLWFEKISPWLEQNIRSSDHE